MGPEIPSPLAESGLPQMTQRYQTARSAEMLIGIVSIFYGEVIDKIVWKYLEPTERTTLPRTYIHLIRVATSPQWQRHGAGTLLCNWGIDVARKHKLQIGLLATPSGYGLYTQLASR